MLSIGRQVIAPGIELLLQSTACGELPFGFGRQALAGPVGISNRIVPGDLHDGMGRAVIDVRAGAFGVAPVGCVDLAPPVETLRAFSDRRAGSAGDR